MKAETYLSGQAVRVFWTDSATAPGWRSEPGGALRIVSLGFVAGCDKEALSITTSMDTDGGMLGPLSIPWECIQQVQEVGEQWNRNAKKAAATA
jgi:hypothetical protein